MQFFSYPNHVSKVLKSHKCLVAIVMDNTENVTIVIESSMELCCPGGKGKRRAEVEGGNFGKKNKQRKNTSSIWISLIEGKRTF